MRYYAFAYLQYPGTFHQEIHFFMPDAKEGDRHYIVEATGRIKDMMFSTLIQLEEELGHQPPAHTLEEGREMFREYAKKRGLDLGENDVLEWCTHYPYGSKYEEDD